MSFTDNRYKVKGTSQTGQLLDDDFNNSHFVRVVSSTSNNTITVKDIDSNTLGTVLLYAAGDIIVIEKKPTDKLTSSGNVIASGSHGIPDESIYDPDSDYPVPNSGDYQTAANAFSGMSYSTFGTPAAVTGGITTVNNSSSGLFRKKYNGHYTSSLGAGPSGWDMAFPTGYTFIKSIADPYVSWGFQIDTASQENFSMEWKGYIKVPVTQTYNFYTEQDDDCVVWLGTNALEGNITSSNSIMYGSNQSMPGSATHNVNGLTMDSTKWYPIRLWFTEYSGGSKFQIFLIGQDGTKLNGSTLQLSYNSSTGGYN
jgi:hypothetical protein